MYLLQTLTCFQIIKHSILEGVMNFEISFGGKIYNFISLYCSPSQSSDTFEDFADNLELNLDKIAKKAHIY